MNFGEFRDRAGQAWQGVKKEFGEFKADPQEYAKEKFEAGQTKIKELWEKMGEKLSRHGTEMAEDQQKDSDRTKQNVFEVFVDSAKATADENKKVPLVAAAATMAQGFRHVTGIGEKGQGPLRWVLDRATSAAEFEMAIGLNLDNPVALGVAVVTAVVPRWLRGRTLGDVKLLGKLVPESAKGLYITPLSVSAAVRGVGALGDLVRNFKNEWRNRNTLPTEEATTAVEEEVPVAEVTPVAPEPGTAPAVEGAPAEA